MSYLGIGYTGDDPEFLREMVNLNISWLKGDRHPHFYGDSFIVLYDSNTAREFAKKCKDMSDNNYITLYTMNRTPQ